VATRSTHLPESEAFAEEQQPLGPEIEYADQRTDEPAELRVYRGSDGGCTP